MNNKIQSLALTFALAVGLGLTACSNQQKNDHDTVRSDMTTDIRRDASDSITGEYHPRFDANKAVYDVDTRTGNCVQIFFNNIAYSNAIRMAVASVPCNKEVLDLVPVGKRAAYVAKYGQPKN